MKPFQFTLIINKNFLTKEIENKLYESGCNDALLGCTNGIVSLDFFRYASSLDKAIESAKADVDKAGYKTVKITNIIK